MNLKELIDTAIEKEASSRQSNSLSPSMLNHPCQRHIFYQFRWASNPSKHKAKMLRIFNRGHRDEQQLIKWLKLANIDIKHKKNNGNQIGYNIYNSHIKGFIDGLITIDNKQYILECKSINDATYTTIETSKLKDGNKEHYLQIQLYMHFMKIYDAIYIAINKNNDELYVEHIKYNEVDILSIIELIANLLFTQNIPEQIHNGRQGYICKRFGGCQYSNICLGCEESLKTCRSCIHSEANINSQNNDNSWFCNKHKIVLDIDKQYKQAKECLEYNKLF